jgi:hypothetical protein
MEIDHGPHCPEPYRGSCLKFSTDGTRLGIAIAHQMGTDDETKIAEMGRTMGTSPTDGELTGMDEEMMDWLGMTPEEYAQYCKENEDRGFYE